MRYFGHSFHVIIVCAIRVMGIHFLNVNTAVINTYGAAKFNIQDGARNVIPLIVQVTLLIFKKAFGSWYIINPHRLENFS